MLTWELSKDFRLIILGTWKTFAKSAEFLADHPTQKLRQFRWKIGEKSAIK